MKLGTNRSEVQSNRETRGGGPPLGLVAPDVAQLLAGEDAQGVDVVERAVGHRSVQRRSARAGGADLLHLLVAVAPVVAVGRVGRVRRVPIGRRRAEKQTQKIQTETKATRQSRQVSKHPKQTK